MNRISPNNIEAERAVLGTIITDNAALGAVVEVIDASDFYSVVHSKVFSAILAMTDRNEPVDLVTLSNALRDQGRLEQIGGLAYLSELADNAGSPLIVSHYVRIVKEKSIDRAIIAAASKMMDGAYSSEKSTEEAVSEAQQTILSLSMSKGKRCIQTARDIAKQTFAMIEDRSKRGDALTGISTGLRKLDEITLGLQPGELFILAGRPGEGKTALAISIAHHAAKEGTPVFLHSLEMPALTLMVRMLSGATGIDSHQLRRGAVFGDAWGKLTRATEAMGAIPLFIDDGTDMTPAELRATARRVKADHEIGLLLVDYMQLMRANGRYETREREVAEISRTLKGIARELNIPVIGLSQLNRKVDDRANKAPQLSDLRESGAIEQDADVIAFIYKGEVQGTVKIHIAKDRNGPTGIIDARFDVTTQAFRDFNDDKQPPDWKRTDLE
ncbi:MAG: replicative DNA helicase [Deltaproteobacteria bacterium]|nr:replicative DNA helicase [Deltaproteobacteria bacterium]